MRIFFHFSTKKDAGVLSLLLLHEKPEKPVCFVCCNFKSLATFSAAVIRDIRREEPKMSKIILIIFLFFLQKHFQGVQNEAFLMGNKQWQRPFQRYLTNIKETMTGGPECEFPPVVTEAKHTAADAPCLFERWHFFSFLYYDIRAFDVRNCLSAEISGHASA